MRVTSIKRKRVTPSIAIHYMARVLLFVPAVYHHTIFRPITFGPDNASRPTYGLTFLW